MVEAIQRFIAALRKDGARISPAEAIDAARAARAIGVENRDQFRVALRATLSKTREETARFDRAFESFFKAPRSARGATGRGKRTGHLPEAGGGRRPPRSPEQEPEAGLRRTRPGRLRVLTASRRGRQPAPEPALRRGGEARRPTAPRVARRPAERLPRSDLRAAAVASVPVDPRRVDLTARLPRAAEDRLAREVPRLLREIRLRAGRRLRRGATGRLWTARLMRENIGTEGVPFVIPCRRRRPRRPRVIVLADVSWSVMRASWLFLMMASELARGAARASIYLFVDRCVEATEAVARWKGPEAVPFARLLESLKDLDPKAPSDYGRAFYQAVRSRHGALRRGGSDAVLVVLGDARSNFRDPQEWAFEELAGRCRRVIWLNPEPSARWNTGDSILDSYLPYCDVVCEAHDLEGISRGVAELARAL